MYSIIILTCYRNIRVCHLTHVHVCYLNVLTISTTYNMYIYIIGITCTSVEFIMLYPSTIYLNFALGFKVLYYLHTHKSSCDKMKCRESTYSSFFVTIVNLLFQNSLTLSLSPTLVTIINKCDSLF